MNIDKYFSVLSVKGKKGNEIVAGGESGVRTIFLL